MAPSRKKLIFSGLHALSPALRLGVVFAFSFLYVFVNNLILAALILAAGIFLFLTSCPQKKGLALASVFPGMMLFVYNSILSPQEAGGLHWLVFTLNLAGVERGLVTGFRLVGIMLISCAVGFATAVRA